MIDRLRGFRRGLKETDYIEEENVTIAYRWARISSIGCRRWLLISSIARSQ